MLVTWATRRRDIESTWYSPDRNSDNARITIKLEDSNPRFSIVKIIIRFLCQPSITCLFHVKACGSRDGLGSKRRFEWVITAPSCGEFGPRFNIKNSLSWNRISIKIDGRETLSFYTGNSYTGKTIPSYWNEIYIHLLHNPRVTFSLFFNWTDLQHRLLRWKRGYLFYI